MGSPARPATIDGILDITLHHARHLHNICIYGNQDVYAKFFIAHTQDAVYSTQPVKAGGKNPVFNQSLQILISKPDSVLQCEIWMMSCLRTYLQDQPLGFVLIPLCDLLGKGRVTENHSLSSTELFHTPAGLVCLSLSFYLRGADIPCCAVVSNVSQNGTHAGRGNERHDIVADSAHDMIINATQGMTPMDYDSIEFPDLHDPLENHHLVSACLKMASGWDETMNLDACVKAAQCDQSNMHLNERDISGAPFLKLGISPMTEDDSEMGELKGEEKSHDGSRSSFRDTAMQVDVDRVSLPETPASSKAKEVHFVDSASSLSVELSTEIFNSQAIYSSRRTMSGGPPSASVVASSSSDQESKSFFPVTRATLSLELEEPDLQQQIVDMYMQSMQQFSESLAKMKLPLNLENAHSQVEAGNEPQIRKEDPVMEPTNNDGQRPFYGSRAFF